MKNMKKKEKKRIVISLGGSVIVPDKINLKLLKEFKKVLLKHKAGYKFVVVCGGGNVARLYIDALRRAGRNEKLQALIGISITRVNARFLSYIFGRDPSEGVPHSIEHVKRLLAKQDIVFCGGLRYMPKETSDTTAAKIARALRCEFINITNVAGLYDKNPLKYKNAKFLPRVSWRYLYEKAKAIEYRPGLHFVIDAKAAKILMENKIKTYIIGTCMQELDKLLGGKNFRGTIVEG